ncbi:hypothetical protein [Streptomyces canus]|uniref:hypothetical protein n=1 Tax=Streptomyces canus TaxID=58343 RepID=UPI0036E8D15C
MNEQREGGPGFVLWTTDDFPGYSKLSGEQGREIQNALDEVRKEADRASGLSRPPEGIQKGGDGESVCWKNRTPVPYLKEYVPALSDALDQANKRRGNRPKLRLRLAVTYGTAMDAPGGVAGRPPIEAERLVSSRPCKYVTEKLADSGLVVIISDRVFQDTVNEGWEELDPRAYVPVRLRDKNRMTWAAHITVPGVSPDRVRLATLRQRYGKPAACAAAAGIAVLGLLGALTPWSGPSGNQVLPHLSPTPTVTPSSSPSPSVSPSASPSRSKSEDESGGAPMSDRSDPPASVTPRPTPAAVEYQDGMIENAGNGLVMGVYGDTATAGTPVVLIRAGSDKGEIWTRAKPSGNGAEYAFNASQFFIYNGLASDRSTMLSLDANTNAAQMVSTGYGGPYGATAWTRSEVTGGPDNAWYLQMVSGGATLCLTAHGKGKALTLSTCVAGDETQEWILH